MMLSLQRLVLLRLHPFRPIPFHAGTFRSDRSHRRSRARPGRDRMMRPSSTSAAHHRRHDQPSGVPVERADWGGKVHCFTPDTLVTSSYAVQHRRGGMMQLDLHPAGDLWIRSNWDTLRMRRLMEGRDHRRRRRRRLWSLIVLQQPRVRPVSCCFARHHLIEPKGLRPMGDLGVGSTCCVRVDGVLCGGRRAAWRLMEWSEGGLCVG
jgi:hypothetical protein